MVYSICTTTFQHWLRNSKLFPIKSWIEFVSLPQWWWWWWWFTPQSSVCRVMGSNPIIVAFKEMSNDGSSTTTKACSIKHFLIVIYGQMSINWQWYFPNLCEHLSPKFGHSYEFVIYISVKLVRIAPLISSILITWSSNWAQSVPYLALSILSST